METGIPIPEVSAEQVLDDIASVLNAIELGTIYQTLSEVRETEEAFYLLPSSWQKIHDSLLRLHQGLELPPPPASAPLSPLGRLKAAVKSFIKRMSLKGMYWYVNPLEARVNQLHYATTMSIQVVVDELRRMNDRLGMLEAENLGGRLEGVEEERLADRVRRLELAWREGTGGGEVTPGARGETPSVTRFDMGKDRVADAGRHRSVGPLNFDYYWFESIHRGDRDLIKSKQQPYVSYFEGCRRVLDIGCGMGEFLELLGENDIGCYGIDIESDAVRFCRDEGFEVVEADALEHVSSLRDESIDGVFISQLVEHLIPSELIELVGLIHRKLETGSYAIIETPNPQCLLIFASFFYADLSHVQPVHPETMKFLLLSTGFEDIEVEFINPVPKEQRLRRIPTAAIEEEDASWMDIINTNVEKLNTVLYGYLDYVAIARK